MRTRWPRRTSVSYLRSWTKPQWGTLVPNEAASCRACRAGGRGHGDGHAVPASASTGPGQNPFGEPWYRTRKPLAEHVGRAGGAAVLEELCCSVVCYVCLHTPFSGTCPDGGRWGWWWAASDVGEAQVFETAGRFWTASQSGELFRPWATLLTFAVSGLASGRWSYLVTAIRPALPAGLSPRLFHFLASPLSAS